MPYLTDSDIQQAPKNKSSIKPYKTTNQIILSNLFTFFNGMILVLAAFVATTGHFENLLFVGVIAVNTAIGIYQEVRAKNALENLSLLSKSTYKVHRNQQTLEIDSEEIVLGEYISLNLGEQIPVDAILISGAVEVDESLLTGESEPIMKKVGDTLLSGSNIVSGACLVQATAVGDASYINKLAKDTKKFKKYPSKLRDSMNLILKVISCLLLPIALLLYIRGNSLGQDYTTIILSSAGALVGMIPEGLLLLVSVSLAVAAMKLTKKNVLVQELYCVETLARVDVLCFDKTGTITTGNMTVVEIDEAVKPLLQHYLAYFEDENATSKALKKELSLEKKWNVRKIGAFSSQKKYSYVQVEDSGTYFFGAYEFLGQHIPMDDRHEQLKEQGFRLLSLVHCQDAVEVPTNATLIGHVVLADELKENTKETFDYFNSQDVAVKIISGDNHKAVRGVAIKAGFTKEATAVDMSSISEEDFEQVVLNNDIFGRVTPTQKEKMVRILQQHGKTVAMSGDGVNDVLALKQADISFAMKGATGAAKSVANIVLLTNDFNVFYDILMEGRRVINNIQRVASLFLTKTFFSIIFAVLSVMIGIRFPFIPIQLTIISAITIGVPSFLLTLEESKEKVGSQFMTDILTNASIGGGLLVISSLLTTLIIPQEQQASFLCFVLALVNGLLMVAKVSLPLNKHKMLLLIFLIVAAIVGMVSNYALFVQKAIVWDMQILLYILLAISILVTIHILSFQHKKQSV